MCRCMDACRRMGLPAVVKIPVYREFSSDLCQGWHPPNLAQLHSPLMQDCLNNDVAYIQKLVQSVPNPITAVIGACRGITCS